MKSISIPTCINLKDAFNKYHFDGDFKSYTYEYDTNNNPQLTHFGDQEISKVVGNNFNNAIRNIYTRSGGSSEITIEYTYNEMGYPITSNEFSSGGTLTTQVNYTYQE